MNRMIGTALAAMLLAGGTAAAQDVDTPRSDCMRKNSDSTAEETCAKEGLPTVSKPMRPLDAAKLRGDEEATKIIEDAPTTTGSTTGATSRAPDDSKSGSSGTVMDKGGTGHSGVTGEGGSLSDGHTAAGKTGRLQRAD